MILLLLLALMSITALLLFIKFGASPRIYDVQALPSVGLSASLHTKWVNNSARYIFTVKPAPGNEARFADVLRSVPQNQLSFGIHLLDRDGFELCKSTPIMHQVTGAESMPLSLDAQGELAYCTAGQLRSASRWKVSHRFPLLTTDLHPQQSVQDIPGSGGITTQLTGADFQSGEVETLDAGSFKISRKAEYDTLLSWKAPDVLILDCRRSPCLLTNKRTQESVHASKH